MVFKTPPPGFSPKFSISTGYIEHGDSFLVLLRGPEIPQPNTWALPGGKHEAGESAAEAMAREMFEETGYRVSVDALRPGMVEYVNYPDFDFVIHFFHTKVDERPEVKLSEREHTDYKWVTKGEVLALPLVPGFEIHLREEQLP